MIVESPKTALYLSKYIRFSYCILPLIDMRNIFSIRNRGVPVSLFDYIGTSAERCNKVQ